MRDSSSNVSSSGAMSARTPTASRVAAAGVSKARRAAGAAAQAAPETATNNNIGSGALPGAEAAAAAEGEGVSYSRSRSKQHEARHGDEAQVQGGVEGEGQSPLKNKKVGSSRVAALGGKSSRVRAENGVLLMGPAFSKQAFLGLLVALLLCSSWGWWSSSSSSRSSSSGMEAVATGIRLRELHEFWSKTSKWMQVQVEVVDMKIGAEVRELRREVQSRMGEQAQWVEQRLGDVASQVEQMSASLQGLLSKEEGEGLLRSLLLEQQEQQKLQEEKDEQGGRMLEQVRNAAREIVQQELRRHAADGIGWTDYALFSAGGRVLQHSEAVFGGTGTAGTGGRTGRAGWRSVVSVLASGLTAAGSVKHPMADKVLQPSFGEPGQCLPLKPSSNAFVDIALRTAIFPEAITLEHVDKSVAYDVTSAPKDFRILGWLDKPLVGAAAVRARQGPDEGDASAAAAAAAAAAAVVAEDEDDALTDAMTLLGEFSYSLQEGSSSIQTFNLPSHARRNLVNAVRLRILSNHGSPSHTCIYRFRVHGSPPSLLQYRSQ